LNKIDLEVQREVDLDLVKEFTAMHRLEAIEMSAFNRKGVKGAFTKLAFDADNRRKANQIRTAFPMQAFPQSLAAETQEKQSCCGKQWFVCRINRPESDGSTLRIVTLRGKHRIRSRWHSDRADQTDEQHALFNQQSGNKWFHMQNKQKTRLG
jgi:hypothetical protein